MYTPVALTKDEQALCSAAMPTLPRAERFDCPDWLLTHFDAALGPLADDTLTVMQQRAPIFARVNIAKATPESVAAELAADQIKTQRHPLAETALEVLSNPRRLKVSAAYSEGRVELQDAASQAVTLDFLRYCPQGRTVLDYCAGGGGKALALAAQGAAVTAHDIAPERMRDLPIRAARAGAEITVLSGEPKGLWSSVLADAPCSGSGSWRRSPEAKWAFTPDRLAALTAIQDGILARCAQLTEPQGIMGYVTCSLLRAENEDRIAAFLANMPGWHEVFQRRMGPLDGGDGFFLSVLARK